MRRALTAVVTVLVVAITAPAAASASSRPPELSGHVAYATGRELVVLDVRTGLSKVLDHVSQPGDYIAEPAWSPDGRRLAYAYLRCDNQCVTSAGELRVVSSEGGRPVAVIALPERYIGAPSWSPDGGRIAFATSGFFYNDIEVVDADGANRSVTALGVSAAWSPDGTSIAFEDMASGVDVVDVATGRVRRVSPLTVEAAGPPVWSRSGRIAVPGSNVVEQAGDPLGASSWHVWILDPRRRTGRHLDDGGGVSGPSWSPAGDALTYATVAGIWVASADAGWRRLVVDAPNKSSQYGFEGVGGPAWSPHGDWIIYLASSFDIQRPDGFEWSLTAVTSNGTLQRVVAHGSGFDEPGPIGTVVWSPT